MTAIIAGKSKSNAYGPNKNIPNTDGPDNILCEKN